MAVTANGSPLRQYLYQFAVRTSDGDIKFQTFEMSRAESYADRANGKVVFRVLYCTDWEETIEQT